MTYIYSKKFSHPVDDLTRQLSEEIYTQPYTSINFASYRGAIADADNYYPKHWLLNLLFWILANVWSVLRWPSLVKRAEGWVWELITMEDRNTDYAGLGPVNAPMNTICCFIHDGPESYSFHRHLDRLHDYMWMKDEGMLMNGTNGVQVWDTSFIVQAIDVAGFADDPKWGSMLLKALEFLEDHQMTENVPQQERCYRHRTKGAWPFSTKTQGYTVSDCTAEGLRAALQLQKVHGFPALISDDRLQDAVDTLISMQNKTGGFTEYENTRGSPYLEWLNAAEVFGGIMIGYDYPECTTAVFTALSFFGKFFPDYRAEDIERVKLKAVDYIRRSQRADGSWYGSWGVCFTYAAMFALESLSLVGETYENSERVRRGCEFLVNKQMDDGGWGESYLSSERKVYTHYKTSQVVQTSWACLALMEADYPDKEVLKRAMKLIMKKQSRNGEWPQNGIEGVFNQSWYGFLILLSGQFPPILNSGRRVMLTKNLPSSMISYPNYKLYWPVRALGLYARKFGNEEIL
ncbi:Lanosterol synthase erg7A [Blastomyces dermatitidis]